MKIAKNINRELINDIRYLMVSVKELVFVTMLEIILLVLVFKWYAYGWDNEFEYAELPNSLPRLAAKWLFKYIINNLKDAEIIKRNIKINRRYIKLCWLFKNIFEFNKSFVFETILLLVWPRTIKNGCIEESVNTSIILLIKTRKLSITNWLFLLEDKFLNILLIIWIKDIFW